MADKLVGVRGFEPPAPASRKLCATPKPLINQASANGCCRNLPGRYTYFLRYRRNSIKFCFPSTRSGIARERGHHSLPRARVQNHQRPYKVTFSTLIYVLASDGLFRFSALRFQTFDPGG